MIFALTLPLLAALAYVVVRVVGDSFRRMPAEPAHTTARRKRLRVAALGVLLAGLAAASVIYETQRDLQEDPYEELFGNTKSYERAMIAVGGKSNLYAAQFRDAVVSLWHGRRLAYTVLGLSGLGCLALLSLAHPAVIESSSPGPEPTQPKTRMGS